MQCWRFDEERKIKDSNRRPVIDANGEPHTTIIEHPQVFIAYVFNADNLLIRKHIESFLPDDRRLQLRKTPQPTEAQLRCRKLSLWINPFVASSAPNKHLKAPIVGYRRHVTPRNLYFVRKI